MEEDHVVEEPTVTITVEQKEAILQRIRGRGAHGDTHRRTEGGDPPAHPRHGK